MAETTKKTTSNNAKRVEINLPRNKGQNAKQDEFFSVNFKNYIIRRGAYVEVPEEIEEVIRNANKAEESAMRYVDSLVEAEDEKRKEYIK